MYFVTWESLHPGMGASNTIDASAIKSVWMTSTEIKHFRQGCLKLSERNFILTNTEAQELKGDFITAARIIIE